MSRGGSTASSRSGNLCQVYGLYGSGRADPNAKVRDHVVTSFSLYYFTRIYINILYIHIPQSSITTRYTVRSAQGASKARGQVAQVHTTTSQR